MDDIASTNCDGINIDGNAPHGRSMEETLQCKLCGKPGTHRNLVVPQYEYANEWLCWNCRDKYEVDLKNFNDRYFNRIEEGVYGASSL